MNPESHHLKLTKTHGKPVSSIPIGYWVTGYGKWPEVGYRVHLDGPIKTSLDEPFDWFETTTVKLIVQGPDDRIITTQNSVWKVEKI